MESEEQYRALYDIIDTFWKLNIIKRDDKADIIQAHINETYGDPYEFCHGCEYERDHCKCGMNRDPDDYYDEWRDRKDEGLE